MAAERLLPDFVAAAKVCARHVQDSIEPAEPAQSAAEQFLMRLLVPPTR